MARNLVLATVPAYNDTWLVTVNGGNPKRPNTACWYAFNHFFNAKTVGEFAALHGKGYRAEINWCAARGYISLVSVEAAKEAANPAAKLEAAKEALRAAQEAAENAELEAIAYLEAQAANEDANEDEDASEAANEDEDEDENEDVSA